MPDLPLQPRPFPDAASVFRSTLRTLLDSPPNALMAQRLEEDRLAALNADHWLLELLQNARDAMVRQSRGVPRVRVEPGEDAIIIANDGAPFDAEGFDTIRGLRLPHRHSPPPGR